MKRTMKTLLLLVAVVAAALLFSGCGSTQNVGVLDVNKVMTDSPKVKQFQDQLNTKGKELSDQLEKDKPNISAEEFQKRQEAAYNEFLKMKQDMEGQIDTSIKQTLEQVAKDKKMSIVLYKNGVAQGGTDITDEVISKLQ
ncbi:OmpH family outer membrane protein [Propionispora hippei]|uniref:Outer membrane protein n=1 Tax=Propionispora hippei DSM 15287 TaxID=1123003 RepID=A0A1M6ENC3_9FIRM|nr:OmpH family outer membrane protein [Propionispora hippei]SHI86982.1 outer membrane protein [Propionispora hippei DSM 15287]